MAKSSALDGPQIDGSGNDSVVQGLQKMGYQPELTRVRDGTLSEGRLILTLLIKYSLEVYFISYSVCFQIDYFWCYHLNCFL